MKNETDDLMDAEGWEFWKQFCMVFVLLLAGIGVAFVLLVAAIKLPVVIFGALKMIGGSV